MISDNLAQLVIEGRRSPVIGITLGAKSDFAFATGYRCPEPLRRQTSVSNPANPLIGEAMPDSPSPVQANPPVLPKTAVSEAAFDSETGSRGQGKKLGLGLFLLLLIAGILVVALFFDAVRHWLALHTGTIHGGPDLYYNFWSGFGSDLGEATLISAVGIGVYTGVRKVNCHTKGCWRIGHHPLDGTPYILCRHHHPHVPSGGATHEHILEQHRRYKKAQEANQK